MTFPRPWMAGLVSVLLLVSCTSREPSTPGPPSGGGSSRPPASPVPSASPATVRPTLVLTADLRQRPARWRRIAFIRYGPAAAQLGIELPPVHTSLPIVPRSFTVAPDGSLWILDTVKARVAHFTSGGTYLGAVGGLMIDRLHPRPRDLAFWDGRLVVLDEFDLAASLRAARGGRLGPDVALEDATGRPIGLLYLYPSAPSAPSGFGLADGYTTLDRLGSGPHGTGRIHLGSRATFRLTPGLPVGGGVWLDVGAYRSQSFRVVSATGSERIVQPVRLRMRVGRPHPHDVPAIFSEHYEAAAAGAGFFLVQGSPARTADADAYGGGRWFLRYPTDGSPLVWERLPNPPLPDEFQIRHLATDRAGDVFFMASLRTGVAIYER